MRPRAIVRTLAFALLSTTALVLISCSSANTGESLTPPSTTPPAETTADSAPEPSPAASMATALPSATAPPVVRSDGLTGAPVPPLVVTSAELDEDRINAGAGRFPPLNDPAIVEAADATWLSDDTLVLGAEQNGEARAYPISMMRFHHVSNDILGGEPYLVTF